MVAESDDTLPYLYDEVRIVYGLRIDAHRDIVWKMWTTVRWCHTPVQRNKTEVSIHVSRVFKSHV
jgi:hypothetical protein